MSPSSAGACHAQVVVALSAPGHLCATGHRRSAVIAEEGFFFCDELSEVVAATDAISCCVPACHNCCSHLVHLVGDSKYVVCRWAATFVESRFDRLEHCSSCLL